MIRHLCAALLGLTILMVATPSVTANDDAQVIYLIRHAEKDRSDKTNRNPSLTDAGTRRANWLAGYFKDKAIKTILSTGYKRTLETAAPTAKVLGLKVQTYDPRDLPKAAELAKSVSGNVLIVGHSNTTNVATNLLAGTDYPMLDDNDNSPIFIVTLTDGKANVQIDRSKAE